MSKNKNVNRSMNEKCKTKTFAMNMDVNLSIKKKLYVQYCQNKLTYEDVAAHLRSLRSDNPSSKGHPRPIK